MTGILIVTHGEMATGMMDSLRLIMGEQEAYQTLGLKHGDDIVEFSEKFKQVFVNWIREKEFWF